MAKTNTAAHAMQYERGYAALPNGRPLPISVSVQRPMQSRALYSEQPLCGKISIIIVS